MPLSAASRGETSGLTVVFAESLTLAVEDLLARLTQSELSVMQTNLVVVPSSAHSRYLSQAIATRFGICSGFDFPNWNAFTTRLTKDIAGSKSESIFSRPESLQLSIMAALKKLLAGRHPNPTDHSDQLNVLTASKASHREALDLLRHHLDSGSENGKLATLAAKATKLFTHYLSHCPQLLKSWQTDSDELSSLPVEHQWQAMLWRELKQLCGEDPLAIQEQVLGKLAEPDWKLADQSDIGISPGQTLFMFCLEPLPSYQLELVFKLANHTPIVVYQLAPFIANQKPGQLADHQLSQHLGQGYRSAASQWLADPKANIVTLAEPASGSALKNLTMLTAIQHEIRGYDLCDIDREQLWQSSDSIQIHAGHGIDRQVEILREQLCLLFSQDPQLQPSDVAVLVPDLASYAPLIQADFIADSASLAEQLEGVGKGSEVENFQHPGYQLRARLAATSLKIANPVAQCLLQAISLADQRATSQDLLDFCSSAQVARKFNLSGSDLERLAELIRDSGIKWGVDYAFRKSSGLGIPYGTWLSGVNNLLAGFAFHSDPKQVFGYTLPISQVESTDAILVGKLAEIVSRIRKYLNFAKTSHTFSEWISSWLELVDSLISPEKNQEWLIGQVSELLNQVLLDNSQLDEYFNRQEATQYLAGIIKPINMRANFFNGSMIFANLSSLAAIEHKVVVVLGLDDEHFPGAPDKILDSSENLSETRFNRRQRNQKLLLDAFLAAKQKLIVITQGLDQHTNIARLAPVVIQELLAAVNIAGDDGWLAVSQPEKSVRSLVTCHTLQPFDPKNFTAGSPTPSFDRHCLIGASKLLTQKATDHPNHSWQDSPGQPISYPNQLTLNDLASFIKNPAKAHFKQNRGFTIIDDETLPTELPVKTDPLSKWQLAQQIATTLIDQAKTSVSPGGEQINVLFKASELSGQLPIANLAKEDIDQITKTAGSVANRVIPLVSPNPKLVAAKCSIPTDQNIPEQVMVSGNLQLFNNQLVSFTCGNLTTTKLIDTWLGLVLLSAANQPSDQALIVTKQQNYVLKSPAPGWAVEFLTQLVQLRQNGLAKVVCLPPKTAAGFAGVISPSNWKKVSEYELLAQTWQAECTNEWQYYFNQDLASLVSSAPLPEDPKPDDRFSITLPGVPESRFSQLATWFWAPIAENLEISR